jgi:glycine cleavage system H protein
MNFPQDLRYTDKDEWIRVEGDEAVVGISDYAQNALSDIVYVGDFAGVGDALKQGDMCAVVESVKAASDVYLPAGGTILAVNEALADAPETLNKEPYGGGWLVRIKLSDSGEIAALMDAAAYEKFCAGREH